jgi:hypothetical protein
VFPSLGGAFASVRAQAPSQCGGRGRTEKLLRYVPASQGEIGSENGPRPNKAGARHADGADVSLYVVVGHLLGREHVPSATARIRRTFRQTEPRVRVVNARRKANGRLRNTADAAREAGRSSISASTLRRDRRACADRGDGRRHDRGRQSDWCDSRRRGPDPGYRSFDICVHETRERLEGNGPAVCLSGSEVGGLPTCHCARPPCSLSNLRRDTSKVGWSAGCARRTCADQGDGRQRDRGSRSDRGDYDDWLMREVEKGLALDRLRADRGARSGRRAWNTGLCNSGRVADCLTPLSTGLAQSG